MNESIHNKILWNEAALGGLVLGAFTIVITLLSGLAGRISGGALVAVIGSVVKFLVWAVKFGGCIWLMAFFMKRLVQRYDGVENAETHILGRRLALLSALIVAAYSLASALLVDPEELNSAVTTALAATGQQLDSNTRSALEQIGPKLPVITFFATFLYCWAYGAILSVILSRNIPPFNPFASSSNPPVDEQ